MFKRYALPTVAGEKLFLPPAAAKIYSRAKQIVSVIFARLHGITLIDFKHLTSELVIFLIYLSVPHFSVTCAGLELIMRFMRVVGKSPGKCLGANIFYRSIHNFIGSIVILMPFSLRVMKASLISTTKFPLSQFDIECQVAVPFLLLINVLICFLGCYQELLIRMLHEEENSHELLLKMGVQCGEGGPSEETEVCPLLRYYAICFCDCRRAGQKMYTGLVCSSHNKL